MKNANAPIMPLFNDKGIPTSTAMLVCEPCGLTKREYFAAMAMQGILAGRLMEAMQEVADEEGRSSDNVLAEAAVNIADAVLERLEE